MPATPALASTHQPPDDQLIPVPAAPPGHEYRHIGVAPWSDIGGAVISGIDLGRDLDDAVVAEIRRAWIDHGVIFFRDQHLDAEQQVRFSRRFGPYSPVPFIEPAPEHPEVIAVVREAEERQPFTFGGVWHSDFSFLPEPPAASILYAVETPPYGGDTLWANQYLAAAALSDGMKALLGTARGAHSAVNAYSPKMQAVHDRFVGMTVHTDDSALRVEHHPLIRTHPETGRAAVFANAQYTTGIEGCHTHEVAGLLAWLFQHSTQAAFTFRWQWRPGDLAMWDNRGMQHMAMADFSGHRRAMRRTTVAGDRPR
jgi:taurine dioxygenase